MGGVISAEAFSVRIARVRVPASRGLSVDKRKRPIPCPPGSEARRRFIAYYRNDYGASYREALVAVTERNQKARNTPQRGERCEAKTRRGTACQCKALANGRCKFHGGLSTGPKTAKGRAKVALNLRRARKNLALTQLLSHMYENNA
jgi:hypothetical protein